MLSTLFQTYIQGLHLHLKEISPFRAQSQIIPEDEKERLLFLFNNISLDENFFSDLVIIKKSGALKKFELNNQSYKNVYSSDLYKIYIKNT